MPIHRAGHNSMPCSRHMKEVDIFAIVYIYIPASVCGGVCVYTTAKIYISGGMCVCPCVCTCVYMHVEEAIAHSQVLFLRNHPPCFLSHGLSLQGGTHQLGDADPPVSPRDSCPSPTALCLESEKTLLSASSECRSLNSGLCVCVACALAAEPAPQARKGITRDHSLLLNSLRISSSGHESHSS